MATGGTEHTVRLADGRFLGYAEYGDPQGKPLLFFHGFPGSRVEGGLAGPAAGRLGIRIIALDRPGMGLSDFKRGRTFLDWPDVVVQVADALGIDRFAVAGVSGGGPYAAVCALKIPERLTAAGIISGVGPFDAPGATDGMSRQNRLVFRLGRLPVAPRVVAWVMSRQAKNPERFLDRMKGSFAEPDRHYLDRPEVSELFMADLKEAFRRGGRGAARELVLYSRPWGFPLEEIRMPVHLWQGEADWNVPPSMGRYLAGAIPNCEATFYPGEGHMLIIDRVEEIATALFPS